MFLVANESVLKGGIHHQPAGSRSAESAMSEAFDHAGANADHVRAPRSLCPQTSSRGPDEVFTLPARLLSRPRSDPIQDHAEAWWAPECCILLSVQAAQNTSLSRARGVPGQGGTGSVHEAARDWDRAAETATTTTRVTSTTEHA